MAGLTRLRVAPDRDRLLGASELARMHLVALPTIGSLRRFPPAQKLYEVVAIQADVAFVPGTSDRGPIIYLVQVSQASAHRTRRSGGPSRIFTLETSSDIAGFDASGALHRDLKPGDERIAHLAAESSERGIRRR